MKTKAFVGYQPSTDESAVHGTGEKKVKVYGSTEEAIKAAVSWGADIVFTVSPTAL